VQPSHYEGLSIAMLEGLAAGLPMVSTRVQGLDEVLIDGGGAIVCDVKDIEGLARGMMRLENSAELRAEFVAALKPRVLREFSSTTMHTRYQEIYRRLGARIASA
jgi:glycosyltransferase involved in cell wall biosynthesis